MKRIFGFLAKPACAAVLCALLAGAMNCSGETADSRGNGKAANIKESVNAKSGFSSAMLKEGDIIFHQSKSDQSEAVRIATNSRFNHMAIIFSYKGKFVVFEAVQPVKITPLEQFIKRGNNSFVIKRLGDYDGVMTPETIAKMKELGKTYIGKNYDIYFRWDDKRIYCSELVWKLYKYGADIEVGRLQKASDMNLDSHVVRRLIEKRYGKKNTIPPDEIVISPQSIYECDRLVTVYEQ